MMLFCKFLVTAVAMAILLMYFFSNCDFIALIHPIQWTIANSGRCRPDRQTSEKDVLCFHRLAGPHTVHRQVAHRTSFLSRQSDVIASFSFGACTACTEYFVLKYFKVIPCLQKFFVLQLCYLLL